MMNRWDQFKEHLRRKRPEPGALSPLRFLGPGLLVTVGFIDPGNWAANLAAGSRFGTELLWVVTLGTGMLILLQHNAAHLGIATGLCMSEAATRHMHRWIARPALFSAVLAAVATAFAEIMGGAIALQMLFHLPLRVGACLTTLVVAGLLFWNSYRSIEKLVIGFVSIIGLAFLFELLLVQTPWKAALVGWVKPSLPLGSTAIVMSVLGAVVMPHNLFLHSEFIQSRQWNRQDPLVVESHLRFELFDTLVSMLIGWAINSAMILLAAATFFRTRIPVEALEQAEATLRPMLGPAAALVFGIALLCAGLASTITAGMAGGSIYAGLFDQEYDIRKGHSRAGVGLTLGLALGGVFIVTDTFQALIVSQVMLSIQLPITILLLIYLTSSKKVMGSHANTALGKVLLWTVAGVVIVLNVLLLRSTFTGS